MRSFNKSTLVLAAVIASTASAKAADMVPPVIETPQPPEVITQSSSGWYLRGDIGYVKSHTAGASYYVDDAGGINNGEPLLGHFRSESLGDTWSIGAGIGYQISDTWRVDFTVDRYNAMDFEGDSSTSGTFACSVVGGIADDAIADTCEVTDSSEVTATTLMANAYADLGTFSGITPYVGVGIGGAKLHWTKLRNDIDCVGGNCTGGGGENYSTVYDSMHGGKHAWRFAYSLHAGASYDINCHLKADAGYTFTHIDGGGNMFGFTDASGAPGTQGYHGDIKLHKVRAGLRYMLGGCSTPDYNVYK